MNYIPVKKHWINMYEQHDFYKIHKRFPIHRIRLKSLRNKVDKKEVLYMLMNFNKEAWMPIIMDKDYFLTDGQHRLELARQFGIEFIDVIILDEKKLKQNNI